MLWPCSVNVCWKYCFTFSICLPFSANLRDMVITVLSKEIGVACWFIGVLLIHLKNCPLKIANIIGFFWLYRIFSSTLKFVKYCIRCLSKTIRIMWTNGKLKRKKDQNDFCDSQMDLYYDKIDSISDIRKIMPQVIRSSFFCKY